MGVCVLLANGEERRHWSNKPSGLGSVSPPQYYYCFKAISKVFFYYYLLYSLLINLLNLITI